MKLTADQAVQYVKRARSLQAKCEGSRLGQNLFCILPGALCDIHRNTETDFYYWVDDEKVLVCFYENYVES